MIEVTVSELRDKLADLLGKVQHGEEVVHIQRHGKPVAVMISAGEFEFLESCEGLYWAKEAERLQAEPGYDPNDRMPAKDFFDQLRAEEAGNVAAE